MPSKNPRQRLQDIIENIELIKRFVSGMTAESFVADIKTVYAVERAILVISEAVRKLPDEIKKRNTDIDRIAAAGIGNKIRHDYDSIDEMIVWNTVQESIEALRAAVEAEVLRLAD